MHGGERHHRLGDEVAGILANPRRGLLALLARRRGPDQHAVAAGLVGRLDDELLQMREHVLAILVAKAQVRRHVRQNGLLVEVEANHIGNIGVDHLVVGDARARRID